MKMRYILFFVLYAPAFIFGQSTVCKDPVILSATQAPRFCEGELAEFKVVADHVVSYKWQARAPDTSQWFDLSSPASNTSTLSFIANMAGNHYSYRCKLTGNCSVIYTPLEFVAFIYQPAASTTPIVSPVSSVTRLVAEDAPLILEVEANEDVLLANWGSRLYQWQYSTSATGDWTNLEGEIERKMYLTGFPDRNGYRYRCLVSGCSSKFSGVVTLSIVPSNDPNRFNYVKETILLKAADGNTDVAHLPVEDRSVSVSYFDGLGRSLQSVTWQASPAKRDMIQPMAYDKYGRETRKYLAFTDDQANGYYKFNHQIFNADGDYTGTAKAFYAPGSVNQIADDDKPWAETVFEPSPLNRVLSQGAPGVAWQPSRTDSDHLVRYDYLTNVSNDVLLWKVVGNECKLSEQYYYDPGKLYLTVIKSENWQTSDGDNGVSKEYKDKEGRVILKRMHQDNQTLDTYYVYDDLNNLRFVLPPEASKRVKTILVAQP